MNGHLGRRTLTLAFLVAATLALAPVAGFADDAPDDREFLENLTLLRGRLEVSRELVRLGKAEIAVKRHLGDNLKGRYGKLEGELTARKLAPFKPDLDALVAAATKPETFDPAFARVVSQITAAEAAISPAKLGSAKFTGGVIADLVAHAVDDYKAAVKDDGKIGVIKEFEEVYGYNVATVSLYKRRLVPLIVDGKTSGLTVAIGKLEQSVNSPVAVEPVALLASGFEAIGKTIKSETEKLN